MSAATDTRESALDRVLDDAWSSAPESSAIGADLFKVVDALDSSVALRRAATDPATSEQGRQQLLRSILQGKVAEATVDIVTEAAALRWSGGRAFVDALERQAIRACLLSADGAGQLDEAEDELFRFARVVQSDPDVRNALSDRSVPLRHRHGLVTDLLHGRATDTTVELARRAVGARERTFAHTIETFVTLAASMKNRVVATVRVAQPLDREQRERLRAALARQVGREVAVQEIVDPDVLGGIRVELGDEVIEGTVAGRLDEAHRLFGS